MQKKISMTINATIVLLVFIGTIFMFFGITFMPIDTLLDSSEFNIFKYFTVDSNILMGIVSIIFLVYEIMEVKKVIKKIPDWVYLLKYVGVSSVALTFLTTLIFLTPQFGVYPLYSNSNLIFHLIVPVLAFISYFAYDKTEKSYFDAIIGIIPMLIYSFYYAGNIIAHIHSEDIGEYDFYGFLGGNVANIVFAIPILFIIDFLIASLLIFINKRVNSK